MAIDQELVLDFNGDMDFIMSPPTPLTNTNTGQQKAGNTNTNVRAATAQSGAGAASSSTVTAVAKKCQSGNNIKFVQGIVAVLSRI